MPTCKKCKESFSNTFYIDGHKHNAGGSRKYCLKCSPFGKHNTRKLEFVEAFGDELVCAHCGRSYSYNRYKGHTRTLCNSCKVNTQRFDRKQKCLDYKGGSCEICGYDRCKEALAFHHTDPAQKDFIIGGSHSLAWKTVQRELDKCILVCANCHAEIHSNLELKQIVVEKRGL